MRWTLPFSLAVGGLALVRSAQGKEPERAFTEERVKAIAVMLREHPAGFGRPISDRGAWDELAKQPSYQKVIPLAERYLTEPIPEQPDDLYLDFSRTGNRTRWQHVCGKRRNRVAPLVLAECLENKGRFLPAIDKIVRVLCAERTWVMPAHDRALRNFNGEAIDIDLASSALAWQFAMLDFLLGDRLLPDTRRLIRDNVHRRVLEPYRDMATGKQRKNWWMTCTNNWNAVCLAGVTGSALTLIESRDERALLVAAAEEYSKNFLRGFAADGYCTEGLGYWNYGFGHYLLLAEAICQATDGGVDLLGREEVRKPATFGARIEIMNGVYPAFADCGVTVKPSPQIMAFISLRYGLGLRRWEENDMVSPRGYLFQAMMYSFPNSASRTPPAKEASDDLGPRTWFDAAGVLICRPGKHTACRLGAALKGGHNSEHHNHNDVGSYIVVVGEQSLIVDPGSEVYTARTFSKQRYDSKVLNSYGHSVPLVAGTLQSKGREARARVVETKFADMADKLVLDIVSAYDVPELKKLERTFIYSRKDAGALTVKDEVEFAEPETFGTAIVTLGQWKKLGPTSLMIYDFVEAVRVDVEAIGGEPDIAAEEIHEDVRTRTLPTRIGINLNRPVTKAAITVTITPIPFPGNNGRLLRNGGFEHETWGWMIPKNGMGMISNEQAATGQHSLKIVDKSKETGSNISSARMAVGGRGAYELRGKIFLLSGSGVGLYVKYLDKDRRLLNETNEKGHIGCVIAAKGAPGKWESFAGRFESPEGTAFLQVWIHSANAALAQAYLDDLEIVAIEDTR